MATDQQDDNSLEALAAEASALDTAIEQARGQLDAMLQAASIADAEAEAASENCSIHEVMGVGRYAIPAISGWEPLLDIIKDKSVDIDYSPPNYPVFDAILDEHFASPHLSDPLDDQYERGTYVHLRENIAAVRNFLMQTYYANTPQGMTPEKAKAALEQIAAYVGDGLYNNLRFGALGVHVIPNHDPTKPFIDMHAAAEPGGKGAQYLYDCILQMHRQSSWMRPFAAVVALFGGKAVTDWMLEDAHFDFIGADIAAIADAPDQAMLTEATQRLLDLQDQRDLLQDQLELAAFAVDLDALGNQLLHTTNQLLNPNQLSEPVRRDAIEIARDILRKLKITLGDVQVFDGLKLNPGDDMAALGGVKGAAMVFERVLAWGRGIDPAIAQHPSVAAATQAVGQLGYLAKLEARRIATAIGNTVLADKLSAQLAGLPQTYRIPQGTRFGDLTGRVENGINTVLNRIQEIQGPGAAVGHSRSNELGSYMSGTPIAGMAMQARGDGALGQSQMQRNIQAQQLQDAAERAQANRLQSQIAQRSQQQQQQGTPVRTGRQQLIQARNALRASSSSSVNPANLSAAQRQQQLRMAAFRAQHDHHDDHHHDAHAVANKIDPNILKGIRAATNTAGLSNAPVTTGRAAYNAMLNANTQGLRPSATPNVKHSKPAAKTIDEAHDTQPPPPHKGGHGRG